MAETIHAIELALNEIKIDHETLVVNEYSIANTESILQDLSNQYSSLRYVNNTGSGGFGYAVRCGLKHFTEQCVAIVMADLSDSPYDLIKFYTTMMQKKVDCVFGTRWSKGGKVID